MTQEKIEHLLAFAAKVVRSSLARPAQIADSFVDQVRHPDPARPMQPRQRDRAPPVRLDPLPRPRRRNHHAVVAKIPDLPTAAAALGNRYRMFHLRHVERDQSLVIPSHGSPSA
jgi:hypothetical protein